MATTVIQALGLVSGVLLARSLGPDDRGELATIILWPSILVYLGDLGGPNAYAFLSAKSPQHAQSLIANALPFAILQTGLLFMIGFPSIWLLTSDVTHLRRVTLLYMLIYIPLNLITRYLNAVNQGRGNFRYFNAVRTSVQAVYVFGVTLLWLIGYISVLAVLIVNVVSNIIAMGVAYWGIRDSATSYWRPDGQITRETFAFGLKSHLGNLTPVDSMRLDVAFVALVLGPYEVGLYTIASSAANIIRTIGSSTSLVALPSVAAASTDEAKLRVTHRMLGLTLALTTLLGAGLILTADWLVPFVYGADFGEAASIAQVLALGMLPATLRQVLGACLRGAGNPSAASKAEVVSWLVLAAGLPILLPLLGTIGVALAVTASYFVALGASYWLGTKTLALSVPAIVLEPSDLRHMSMFVREAMQRRGAHR